jgi:transmembrane 9 superfamily member 2/4
MPRFCTHYNVIWKESDVSWSSRWDIYLSENQLVPLHNFHWHSDYHSHFSWFSFWSLWVISTLVRNLRRDAAAAYKALAALADDEHDEDMDESGWKLIHADVFRPPDNYPMLYGVFVGSGVQLAFIILLSIILSAVGFLNPTRRGSLMNAIFMVFFMLSGIISGFVSSCLYKSFKGHLWQLCTVITAILFPGVALLFILFNIILFFMNSTASAPFLYVIILRSHVVLLRCHPAFNICGSVFWLQEGL